MTCIIYVHCANTIIGYSYIYEHKNHNDIKVFNAILKSIPEAYIYLRSVNYRNSIIVMMLGFSLSY